MKQHDCQQIKQWGTPTVFLRESGDRNGLEKDNCSQLIIRFPQQIATELKCRISNTSLLANIQKNFQNWTFVQKMIEFLLKCILPTAFRKQTPLRSDVIDNLITQAFVLCWFYFSHSTSSSIKRKDNQGREVALTI